VVIGVPLRGVRLGVLVPEAAATAGPWPAEEKEEMPLTWAVGEEAVGGLLGLMMVISGGGGLGVEVEGEVSDAILGLLGTTYTGRVSPREKGACTGKNETGGLPFTLFTCKCNDVVLVFDVGPEGTRFFD